MWFELVIATLKVPSLVAKDLSNQTSSSLIAFYLLLLVDWISFHDSHVAISSSTSFKKQIFIKIYFNFNLNKTAPTDYLLEKSHMLNKRFNQLAQKIWLVVDVFW